jgi:hypothetical protein
MLCTAEPRDNRVFTCVCIDVDNACLYLVFLLFDSELCVTSSNPCFAQGWQVVQAPIAIHNFHIMYHHITIGALYCVANN